MILSVKIADDSNIWFIEALDKELFFVRTKN